MQFETSSSGAAEPGIRIRPSRLEEAGRMLEIWRSSVAATHHFVRPDDFETIERDTLHYLSNAELTVAVDEADMPLAFMSFGPGRLDALFVDAAHRGKGIGRLLVIHAMEQNAFLDTEVNTDNEQALQFYRRLGFEETGYSATDDDGRPYPITRMRLTSGPTLDKPPAAPRPLVTIGRATLEDAEDLGALAARTYADTFGAEFMPDELERYLDDTVSVVRWVEYLAHDRVLLARRDGVSIGFVQFGPGEAAGEVTIHRLYVDRSMHGIGVGTEMLVTALADEMVRQATTVRVEVWENNHGARRLYERFGFRHEGEMEPFVSETGDIKGYDVVLRLRH
ncbi:acetyltransferase [Devosia sp.]|uniref:acetyltransferase n=1 Tax=Devosia sp. TaxID=1871048 RepID=UPI003BAC5650